MKKLLVICGPTATGKTSLGLSLARKFNGEIISADSRQVYQGMDIGTGKDLPRNSNFHYPVSNLRLKNFQIGYYETKGIKIWLYDIVKPDYFFNVADWVKCAKLVIKDIYQRDKLPILVGGTGFYLKALIEGFETIGIPPDYDLRQKINSLSVKELKEKLKKLDLPRWKKMNKSDKENPRRLIRAIEVALFRQKNPFLADKLKSQSKDKKLEILMIGLKATLKLLYQKIDKRVEERIKEGVEKEIRSLLMAGYDFEKSILGATIGYKEWKEYFTANVKKQTVKEIIYLWQLAEHHYAKRQITWFKKQKLIKWFDITQKGWQDKIEKLVDKWYNFN